MFETKLKMELRQLAENYAKSNGFSYDNSHESAIIFDNIQDNFLESSFKEIINSVYNIRLNKTHTKVVGSKELQSSNSSDALAMNIFCHPKIDTWKGIKDLLDITSLNNLEFGFKAKVDDGSPNGDSTEVDIYFPNQIIGECKLTEESFTTKEKSIVNRYVKFKEVFHVDCLQQTETHFKNYQLIRNILAAYQHDCRFVLFCDIRRPDLVKEFIKTVACIKDEYIELRKNCTIIFWQEIADKSGKELKDFLEIKYGIV